jgi:phosphoribosylanthranilate isomerase
MFQVKICGITNVLDARAVAAAGADAVGLNFYGKSPRAVDPDLARRIVAALPERIAKVGLFVNAQPEEIRRWCDSLGLDLVQLHGDEPPELLAGLAPRRLIRAFRVGPQGFAPVADYLARCRQLGAALEAILIDAHVEGAYGGTGEVADWSAVGRFVAEGKAPPVVLAGGLTPDNVAQAIRTASPVAVDTASGVESSVGRKDPALVESFVRRARRAFAAAGSR